MSFGSFIDELKAKSDRIRTFCSLNENSYCGSIEDQHLFGKRRKHSRYKIQGIHPIHMEHFASAEQQLDFNFFTCILGNETVTSVISFANVSSRANPKCV